MSAGTQHTWWTVVGTAILLLLKLWVGGHLASGQERASESAVVEEVTALNSQVEQLSGAGKNDEALPLAKRALTIAGQLDPAHPELARSLDNLARLYYARGDYDHAEPLYQQALAIRRKVLDAAHRDLAQSLNNLAALYYARKDYSRAESLLQQAVAMYEQALGLEHPNVATALNNLAALYYARRDYDRAEPLYQRALAIRRKVLDAAHPDLAESLNNLGLLYQAKRDYSRAEPLLQQALAMYEQILGPEHPDVATALHNLALLYVAKGDAGQAVALLTRVMNVREHYLAPILATGSEDQKHAYMETIAGDLDTAVSLHVQAAPNDLQALRLALTTVLRRKGRVLDAMIDTTAAVRSHLNSEDQALLDQLTAVRAQLATFVLTGPGGMGAAQHGAQGTQLTARAQELEEAISARSAEFRAQAQPVTLERVQAAIPPGAALVEMVAYRPFEPKAGDQDERWGARRYVAYVLHREGDPTWVDLGDAGPIDLGVAKLRRALSRVDRGEVKELARALDEQVMRPVRKLLGETRLVLLSPDETLQMLPFGVLVDEEQRYLLETFTFTYLTTGRDLVRLQERRPAREGPVVIADPAFGETGSVPVVRSTKIGLQAESHRSLDLARVQFNPLPGTAAEAKALQRILPGATVLTGVKATKAALTAVQGPRILHVATHGFFLPDREEVRLELGEERELTPGSHPRRPDLQGTGNPLLRSGLAFTGANRRQSGAEDGVLTALEAAGLDLWGTKLVTLSACETGIGEVENREGVYGLRRAMVIAGAESQVMSLWKVADEATRELMVAYYTRLLAGEGRAEGLRQAQLALLRSKEHSHPFYWASFIVSGDWTPLEG